MKTPTGDNSNNDNDNTTVSSPSNHVKRKSRPFKSKGQHSETATDDINFLDDDSDLSFDEYMDTSDNESSNKKQRGRGASKSKTTDTLPQPIEEEESDLDEAGEKKVDKGGHLLEGREYKVPTFELPNRGNALFMFSKDPAALLNFRDSFVFIKKNPKLVKVYITDEEKSYLVETNKLRSTFRTREVSVVSARSVYKVFGHRVVKKGRRGKDDYHFTGEYDENEPIPDSDDDYSQQQQQQQQQQQLQQQQQQLQKLENDKLLGVSNTNMLQSNLATGIIPSSTGNYNIINGSVLHGAGSSTLDGSSIISTQQPSHFTGSDSASAMIPFNINQTTMPISLKPTLEPLNGHNWLHHAAVSVRDFGAQLHSYRKNNVTFYDIHTNVYQIPHTKQAAPTPKSKQSSLV
ncbi:chromatin remodelling complex Rsc7/Swp82 subunit-domain-containing protein [Chlamydoabsidia padenii]|nr:chromatin remodelling complex Rsc7/Swp82 subunit-domain-containing protein [Chlamydoabsidia padenii]